MCTGVTWNYYIFSERGEYEIVKKEFNDESVLPGTFRIPVVSEEDAGDYECIADNGIVPSISSNFTITINGMHFNFRMFIYIFYEKFEFNFL